MSSLPYPTTPPAPPAPPPRPGRVTLAAVLLLILGCLTGLIGLLFALLGLLVGSFGQLPADLPADLRQQIGNLSSASLGGYVSVLGLILAVYGAAGVAGGIGALMRRGWGRVTGMIVSIVGAIFSLSGIFPTQGAVAGPVVSLVVLTMFAYSAWALISARTWFAPVPADEEPAPVPQPAAE